MVNKSVWSKSNGDIWTFELQNERLLAEQKEYIEILMMQAKEFEAITSNHVETEKYEVIAVMKDKWEAARLEEKSIAGDLFSICLFHPWICAVPFSAFPQITVRAL